MEQPRPPIDLPDDFDVGETRADYTITLLAAVILLALAVIAAVLIWSFQP